LIAIFKYLKTQFFTTFRIVSNSMLYSAKNKTKP